jgi:hypothetical protein
MGRGILENFEIHGIKVNSTYNGMIATNYTDEIVFENEGNNE